MSRSVFPESTDKFLELFDLPADKFAAATRLTALKTKSNPSTVEQNEIRTLTDQLKEYLVTPETMNMLQDCITALEIFFRDNVQGYLENKQKVWDSYIHNFAYQGPWSNTTTYKFQNIVTYNGDLYLAIKDVAATTTGFPATTPASWVRLSSKGDKGDIGLNAFYKGDYRNNVAYAVGDAVSFNDVIYIAKLPNTGVMPTDTTKWYPYQQFMVVNGDRPAGISASINVIKIRS